MPLVERSRALLATVVGWVLAAVVVWVLARLVLGTVFWILRAVLVVALLLGLLWLYLALKPKPPAGGRARR